MKKATSVLLAVILLFSVIPLSPLVVSASASTTEPEHLTTGDYEYDAYTDHIVITLYTGSDKEVTIPDTLKDLPVTEIAGGAFCGNQYIETVTIPDTVKTLGSVFDYEAYYYDDWDYPLPYPGYEGDVVGVLITVADITIISTGAFTNCPNLTTVDLGSVEQIGASSFEKCDKLEEITVPESTTEIGPGAFCSCNNLKSVSILGAVSFGTVDTDSLNKEDILDSLGITEYGIFNDMDYVYYDRLDCYWHVDKGAFAYCTNLENVDLGSVTTIGNRAFSNCTGLTNTSVTIPSSVTSIGDDAFSGCTGLTSVTIPSSVTSIDSSAFYGCTGLTSVTIPSSVTSIDSSAFYGCTGLTSVTIPSSVTSIDSYMFRGCTGLTSVTIPSSVTSIGSYAFYGCTGLTSVTIPASVTSIESCAFYGCTRLTSTYYPGTTDAWENIKIDPGNDCLINSHIIYLSAPVSSVYKLNMMNFTKLTLDYSVKEDTPPLQGASIEFTVNCDNLLKERFSVYFNNRIITRYTIKDNNTFTVPLTKEEGSIAIVFAGLPEGTLTSAVHLNFTDEDGAHRYALGAIRYDESITLRTDEITGAEMFRAFGTTTKGTEVKLTVDDVDAGSVTANNAGEYSTDLTIPNPESGKVYTVKASYTDAYGVEHSSQSSVKYDEGMPVLKKFTMTYRGIEYDLLDSRRLNATFILQRYGGNYPFKFTVQFDRYVNKAVFITSVRQNVTKKMMCGMSTNNIEFVAKGFFEPYEEEYVPGELGIVLADQYMNSTFINPHTLYKRPIEQWAIDPSGYVYAGIDSDRVYNAEVTAYCIPYDPEKDDDSFWDSPDESRKVKWDASEFNQQNPLYTTLDGDYAWDVPEGWWQLEVKKDGYKSAKTEWMTVLPPQLDVNIDLETTMTPSIESAQMLGNRINLTFVNAMKPDSLQGLTVKDSSGAVIDYEMSYTAETGKNGEELFKTCVLTLGSHAPGACMIECAEAENYAGIKGALTAVTELGRMLGDFNRDGEITIMDVTLIQQALAIQNTVIDSEFLALTDVNRNGKGEIVDATYIQRYVAGMKIPYTIGK